MLKSFSLSRPLLLIALVAVAVGAQAEDVRCGGARAFGLAGTGIALPLDVYETHTINPALLGLASKRFHFGTPYVGYHTQRISLGQVNDLIGQTSGSSVSDDEILKLARKYGRDTKELGVNAGVGLSVDGFALSGRAETLVRSIPNATLSAFLKSGDNDYLNTPIESRLDAYDLGYYEGDAAYGYAVRLKKGDTVSVGANVRAVTAYYAHKIADGQAIANNGDVRNGTEISSNDDFIRRSGVGVDLGGLASLHSLPDAYFGFNVRNLVEPNVTFVRSRPDTDFPLTRDLRPFRRQVGVGASYVKKKYLVALDVVDLGNHAGVGGFRGGAEYSVNKLFAVRAGYDTRKRFTAGVSVLGGQRGHRVRWHHVDHLRAPVLRRVRERSGSLASPEGTLGCGSSSPPDRGQWVVP